MGRLNENLKILESGRLLVTFVTNPFDPYKPESREIKELPRGTTVEECLAAFKLRPGYDFVIALNGKIVPYTDYILRMKPVGNLSFCAVPQGSGGSGKDVLRIVATVALIVATAVYAPQLAPYVAEALVMTSETAAIALTSAVMLTSGSLLINALLPISTTDLTGSSSDYDSSPTYGWNAEGNSNREGVVWPVLYGTTRIKPPIINKYIEVLDDDQYYNILYGVSDHLIDSFDEDSVELNENPVEYDDTCTWEYRLGETDQAVLPYFDDSRTTKVSGAEIGTDWVTVRTDSDLLEGLGVAISLPNGLAYANDRGGLSSTSIYLDIEYRKVGDVGWTRLSGYSTTETTASSSRWSAGFWLTSVGSTFWYEYQKGSDDPSDHIENEPAQNWEKWRYSADDYVWKASGVRTSPIWRWVESGETIYQVGADKYDFAGITGSQTSALRRVYYRDRLPAGEYDVRVRFHDGEAPNDGARYVNTAYLDYIEEIIYDDFTYPGSALFAIRALATGTYSGSLPEFTIIATRSTVNVWTGSAYEEKPADNPAWAAYDMLHNSDYGGSVAYDRIIYQSFSDWADYCTEQGFTCNVYFDTGSSLRKVLDMLGLLGRGVVVQVGSMYTCFVDKPVDSVAQCFMFNVSNMQQNSFEIEYVDLSERANVVEVTYNDADDNYDNRTLSVKASNYDEETMEIKSASLSLVGCTDSEMAARHGRFYLNQNRLITSTTSWIADVDSIGCVPWDVVEVQHDSIQSGGGGRVVSSTTDVVTLDKPVWVEPCDEYDCYIFRVKASTDVKQTFYLIPPGEVTFSASENTVVWVDHYCLDGTKVSFTCGDGGVLAEPLSESVSYYIVESETGAFKLALTKGGDPIDLTTDGSGSVTITLEETLTVLIDGTFDPVPELHDLWTLSKLNDSATKLLRITRIERYGDLTKKITGTPYDEDIYDDDGTIDPVETAPTLTYVSNLRVREVWPGFVGTQLVVSWGGSAMYWYVKYKQTSAASWTSLGRTSSPNAVITDFTYGVEYTINVSPSSNPSDGIEVTITPTGTVSVTGSDGSGMVIDGTGIHIYSNDGAEESVLPSDGSYVSLSSPTITVQTAGAVQTAEGIGDGITNAAGIYICNTGIYACEEGQLLAEANVRILSDGSAYFAGQIEAASGTIGGWIIDEDSITDASGAVGLSSEVTGSNDIRFWAGDVTPADAPFKVYEDGSIHASSGDIGGFYIEERSLYAWGGHPEPDFIALTLDDGIYLGGEDPETAPFLVTYAGVVRATSGTIGGWTLGDTYFMDTAGTVGLSSEVTGGNDIRIWAGDATPANAPFQVYEDGTVSSGSFVSGALGTGWQISSDGSAEFQDISVRGVFRTVVFEKDVVSCVGGMTLISNADVLDAAMTADDDSDLVITGTTTFTVNDVLRIKDGTDDEWLIVTGINGNTYTVTRDLAGSYDADDNPVWSKGTAVVCMGGVDSSTGFILLDAASSYSPFIDIYNRESSTYDDYTLKARIGWLKGITDADVGLSSTDVWGIYSDSVYLKGTIVANAGYIGGTTGWEITTGYIKKDTGTNSTSSGLVPADYPFYAGKQYASRASAPFRVSKAGVLTATSATITGSVTATSGTIGGWSISSTSLYSAAGLVGFHSASYTEDAEILLGHPTLYASAKIGLKGDGSGKLASGNISWDTSGNVVLAGPITCSAVISGGTISGGAISGGTIDIGGEDTTSFHVDSNGNIWSGAASYAAGVFKVSSGGALTATNAYISGLVSGSYLYGSSLLTKGSYLSATCSAAASTIHVGDTSDFASSGTAWIIDSSNDRDAFTYTGKTSTTLTGCSGVLAHTVSSTNRPLVVSYNKGFFISDVVSELRYYGTRGSVVEELASIGLYQDGSDYTVAVFGTNGSDNLVAGVKGLSYQYQGVYGSSIIGQGVYGVTTSGFGVYGSGGVGGIGVAGYGTNGNGVNGHSTNAYGGRFVGGLGPVQLVPDSEASAPTHSAGQGTLWVTSAGVLYINTNGSTTWQKVADQ